MNTSKTFTLDFREIKQRVSFRDVLDHYDLLESLKGSGDSLRGKCPICGGDNGTKFSVNLEKGCYNCFGGCSHGNVMDFVMAMEDCSVKQAAQKLAQWFDLEDGQEQTGSKKRTGAKQTASKGTSSKPKREEKEAPKPTFNKPLGFALQLDQSHPYPREDRKLSQETIEEFGIGFCARGIMKDRIAIPIHNLAGELVAYVGRWVGEGDPPADQGKYHFPDGFQKGMELFNCHRAFPRLNDQPLVIVEGVFPCMWLHQLGYAVVGTLGASLTDSQFELIRRHTHCESRFEILYDEDGAGERGREQAALKLATIGFVGIITLPEKEMQPDDLPEKSIIGLLSTCIDDGNLAREGSHAK